MLSKRQQGKTVMLKNHQITAADTEGHRDQSYDQVLLDCHLTTTCLYLFLFFPIDNIIKYFCFSVSQFISFKGLVDRNSSLTLTS